MKSHIIKCVLESQVNGRYQGYVVKYEAFGDLIDIEIWLGMKCLRIRMINREFIDIYIDIDIYFLKNLFFTLESLLTLFVLFVPWVPNRSLPLLIIFRLLLKSRYCATLYNASTLKVVFATFLLVSFVRKALLKQGKCFLVHCESFCRSWDN